MQALWLYIKHNQLQDGHEREYINCNRYFRQVSKMLPCLLLLPYSPTSLRTESWPRPRALPNLGTLSRSSVVADSVSLRSP